jgi:hypothetical protein
VVKAAMVLHACHQSSRLQRNCEAIAALLMPHPHISVIVPRAKRGESHDRKCVVKAASTRVQLLFPCIKAMAL